MKKEEILKRLKQDKKLLAIVLLGVAAVMLLLLSEIGEKNKVEDSGKGDTSTAAEDIKSYSESMEKRLEELVCLIDGAGQTKIMLTVESGEQQVYAINSKSNMNNSDGANSLDSEYIVIETGGDEGGLPVKVIQPEIRGVAVVCEGADSPQVRMAVTEAVTAVLGISSARVSVTQMQIK